jgi:transposase InsO family protein
MSGKGDCRDDRLMESFWGFWGTLKTELVNHKRYETREQGRASNFESVEVFYNRQSLHSSPGYLSPEPFEAGLN